MAEAEATTKAEGAGLKVRVTARDHAHYCVTMDYHTDRVNFHIVDGVVTRADLG
ncbi:hypothetical protein [Mycobacteroides abscessus]|uniref:hypothetical protein n=1 Tax=Mycobacteroides abscessus TaxID=36809 RepID=UPI0018964EDF|nr:hypothetical protein [Mycobacteroides abscessus]